MKRTSLVIFIAGVLAGSFFLVWPADNAAWGEDQTGVCVERPKGTATQSGTEDDPAGYISEELDRVGLSTGEIQAAGDDRYLVDVENFDSRSDALATTGKFRPCTLKVRLDKGKIQLERCGLEDAGLIPNTKRFPSSLKIEDGDIWGRPQ
jgi:hypothetical protein